MQNPHIQSYLNEVEKIFARGNATEHSYRGALQELITNLHKDVHAVNEPKRIKVGAPDYIILKGQTPLGYIEAKDIGVDITDRATKAQVARYVEGLGNVMLTDYLEFQWFEGDPKTYRTSVRLATQKGKKLIREENDEAFVTLFNLFLATNVKTVKSAKELAHRMANLAKIILDTILRAIQEVDPDYKNPQLHDTMRSFREVLLHDMTEDQFADMYAQTISYGMFAARVNHAPKDGPFERRTAGFDLPKTNPFLRQLFNTIGGTELDDRVTWAVDDLAGLLRHTDMEGILRDFGTRTKQEDPVVHFYETFLAAYDPKLRESRGVYYTPEPVVSYIVRSVDHILKTEFGLPMGLADSTKIKSPSVKKSPSPSGRGVRGEGEPEPTQPDLHKVLILDPACGTGTFLHGVIDQIQSNFKGNEGAWSSYVSEHLLPRIFGFELLMAPYAVAHLKLGLQLKEYGYDFKSDERLRVYLTNTLEEAFTKDERLPLTNWLANEANAANEVKRDLPIMVVLGNPPYSVASVNKSRYIEDDIRSAYYPNDSIKEANPKLILDDYVKFIRFSQKRIAKTGFGILAFITNHGFLENPTFRRMRHSLQESFDEAYILNLHGNTLKREIAPDGAIDENVFDIMQGVAISIFVKRTLANNDKCVVRFAELWGKRVHSSSEAGVGSGKYPYLLANDVSTTKWQVLLPAPPFELFVPSDGDLRLEFDKSPQLSTIFTINSTGVKTHRDDFVVDFEMSGLRKRIEDFRSSNFSDDEIRAKYQLHDTGAWAVKTSRALVKADEKWKEHFASMLYRPFDRRAYYHSHYLVDRPREEVMRHMLLGKNIGLSTTRSVEIGRGWEHLFCSTDIIQHHTVSLKEVNYLFPLYTYPILEKSDLFSESAEHGSSQARSANLSAEFIEEISKRLKLTFLPDGTGDLKKTFGPEDIFHYMYAVFHSPAYRSRYAEFLKIDFPRLPLTSDRALFAKLCALGAELVGLHLMEKQGPPIARFPISGSDVVEFVKYVEAGLDVPAPRVQINAEQYFEGVPAEVWNFHIGGYQVAHKWLKDRKGRKLTYEDNIHYRNTLAALAETIRLMGEVDEVIAGAGGFPFK